MTAVFVAVGVVFGALLLDGGGGFLFGGLVGFLIAQVAKLRRRVREIEGAQTTTEVVTDAGGPITRSMPAGEQPPPSAKRRSRPMFLPSLSDPAPCPRVEPSPVEAAAPSAAGAPFRSRSVPTRCLLREVPSSGYRDPSSGALSRLFEPVKTWATTGNVPVKVGILLSLIGLGFLLGVALE